MKTRTGQLEFIRMNLNALSYCAWQGFLGKGRGLVYVPVDECNEVTQMVPFYFLPEGEAARIIHKWPKHRESLMVAEYDPKTEVVVRFVRSKGERIDVDCYRLKLWPAPPMAEEP